jgi:hypothetical protein
MIYQHATTAVDRTIADALHKANEAERKEVKKAGKKARARRRGSPARPGPGSG